MKVLAILKFRLIGELFIIIIIIWEDNLNNNFRANHTNRKQFTDANNFIYRYRLILANLQM